MDSGGDGDTQSRSEVKLLRRSTGRHNELPALKPSRGSGLVGLAAHDRKLSVTLLQPLYMCTIMMS